MFLVASLTDLLDGRIARQRGLITDFGKIADPIADKALTGAALVTLSVQGQLAWWVTAVILARELGVTALRFWVIRHGVIAASRGGKIKTLLQVLAISLYVLPGPPGAAAGGRDGPGGRGDPGHRRGLRGPGRAPAPPQHVRGGPVSPRAPRAPGRAVGAVASGDAAAELIALLTARQQSIAVAESLTGGLLAASLTDIPGASAVFRGGVVAYATELKAVLLGVDRGLLDSHGAVSAEVAAAMAEGVRGPARRRGRRGHHRRRRPGPGRGETRRHGVYRGQRRGSDPGPPAGPGRQPRRHPRRHRPRSAGAGPCHRAGREPMITVLR